MSIRLAIPDDVQYIEKIYNHRNIQHMNDRVKYTEYDFFKCVENKCIYVYTDENNKAIGFILYYDHITWFYIEILCVDINYRGKRIGKALLDMLNPIGNGLVELCCHIDDEETIKFIERNGYKESNQTTKWYYKQK